ncbi:M48 family metallopeptidase [Paenibacillus filicis]|uniref:M48 family metallopeptidase n=1 Tax=Paenibacillus gyeongsangnamensis TaxID=3388067 RepID=A0ABT4Q9V1_9BACL|nr:M48 family metallopeptidase [Paenibacillus filicis]MCZ8513613.1 M48 family metallopeptidase [Paenibacillus filicis]
MSSRPPFVRRYILFLLIYAAAVGLYLWYESGHAVPPSVQGTEADPAVFLTPEQLQQSKTYSAMGNWLYFVSYPWEWGIYLIMLFCGYARGWQRRLEGTRLPKAVQFAVYLLWLQLTVFVAFLPLRITGYALSRHYGISTQTIPSWLRDKAVSFGINYLTILAGAAVAFWLLRRGGRWWLKLWLISVPFTLFLMYIQPVVIDPLYNQFSRLSDPQLEQRILALASQAHIPADRVYEVNMSQKTNSINAYVNGIGGSLRIVLWDTTLKKMTEQEILLIMAHEMGHYVMHHLEWSAAGAVASSFVLFWLGSRILPWSVRRWGDAAGIRRLHDLSVLPLIMLLLSLLSFAASPIENAVSRQAEHAADVYGLKLIGSTAGAVTMYQKLASSSLGEVNPPPLVRFFTSSHPSIMERILYVESVQAGRQP